jgi:hypothetical protein
MVENKDGDWKKRTRSATLNFCAGAAIMNVFVQKLLIVSIEKKETEWMDLPKMYE